MDAGELHQIVRTFSGRAHSASDLAHVQSGERRLQAACWAPWLFIGGDCFSKFGGLAATFEPIGRPLEADLHGGVFVAHRKDRPVLEDGLRGRRVFSVFGSVVVIYGAKLAFRSFFGFRRLLWDVRRHRVFLMTASVLVEFVVAGKEPLGTRILEVRLARGKLFHERGVFLRLEVNLGLATRRLPAIVHAHRNGTVIDRVDDFLDEEAKTVAHLSGVLDRRELLYIVVTRLLCQLHSPVEQDLADALGSLALVRYILDLEQGGTLVWGAFRKSLGTFSTPGRLLHAIAVLEDFADVLALLDQIKGFDLLLVERPQAPQVLVRTAHRLLVLQALLRVLIHRLQAGHQFPRAAPS